MQQTDVAILNIDTLILSFSFLLFNVHCYSIYLDRPMSVQYLLSRIVALA